MAKKKTPAKTAPARKTASPSASVATKKSYKYALNMHVPDSLVLAIGGVIGPVQVTSNRPGVAHAAATRGRTYTLTISAAGAGKTTIVAKGRTGSIIFTFTFALTVKAQLAASKPAEQLPTEAINIPLIPLLGGGQMVTVTYPQLSVSAPDLITGDASHVVWPPNVVIVKDPAPNTPMTITPISLGTANVTVTINYLKFRATGAPAPTWGTAAPISVQGAPTKTTVLTGTGSMYSIKLVQVKLNFDFRSQVVQQFLINVVGCPDSG